MVSLCKTSTSRSAAGTGGIPTMGIFNGDGSPPLVSSTVQLPLNQWVHLACTYDGNNGAIYINGTLTGSGPLPVGPPNVVRTNNYLGRSAFPGDAYANAIIDEVRIWNVARTPSQIQTYMNRPLSGAEPGLIGYWRFDDDAGTNAVDGSGRGNTAILGSNAVWTVSGATVNLAAHLTSLPAINITASSATLQALVDPNGSPTAVYFAYGTNQSYGFTNFLPNIGGGIGPVLVTNNISSLLNGTVYHFQVSASNSFGFVTGPDQTFLVVDPPAVTTLPATSITAANVTLNGAINPYGGDVSAWFQYGLTTNYDSLTTPTLVSGTNQSAISISNLISGLYPGIPYHFRLVGSNANTTVVGSDLTFTPPAIPPLISAQTVSSISSMALLSATVAPNGADTLAWFQYGTTTNYGSVTLSTNISGTNLLAQPVFAWASNLSYGVVYHFQMVATNSAGASYGGDQVFATPLFGATATSIPAVFLGGMAWGDFDNDGLMDVVISGATDPSGGNPITQVWRNTGSGFAFYAGLPGVVYSSVAVGDFDNDGLLDIVIAGYNGGATAQVWRNTGSGFSLYASLPGVYFCSVAVGDYDNDGLPDILLSGISNSGDVTQVWRNTGTGFTNINAGLPGTQRGSVAWGDYDNDGRLDILLAGSGVGLQVFRNTGSGFSNSASLPLDGYVSSVAWGDFDNDGRLDILASGGFSPTAGVWRNTGTNFTFYAGLPGRSYGSVACGDLNGDGKLDILISGDDGGYNFHTQVWLNTGTGFAPCPEMQGLHYTAAAFADFDNDGRLDLLISGLTQNALVFTTQLWRNVSTPTNSLPTAPSSLASAISPSALTLRWNASSDNETAAAGLSYNLRVGTMPGGSDIIAPMADTNGVRRVAQRGSIQSPQISLQLPPFIVPGTRLYWSVQSIDPSFAGSPFAPETSVVVQPFFDNWSRRGDGAFQAQFNVQSGTNYTIQASTDMIHWSDVFDFTFGTSGPVLFTDPTATNYPVRFYRFGQN